MKHFTFFALALLMLTGYSSAQNSNLSFYSQDGQRFHVVLNGIKQNAQPETNVKVTELNQAYYKAKIIFEDAGLGEIDKTINFEPGTESVFAIKKNKKEVYVLRWQSAVPIAQAPPAQPSQHVIIYSTTPPPVATEVTVTETSTTTVTSATPTTGESVSMGINVNDGAGGVGMNINVNVNDQTQTTGTSTSTYSTTTTTTSAVHTEPEPVVYALPGYNGAVGCPMPMNDQNFGAAKNSISSKTFEDSKLTIAKQVINANCLLCKQVKEIMLLFDFEDTKLELAKYAYGYTYDMGNYYQLNDAFDFESSIDELNAYISAR